MKKFLAALFVLAPLFAFAQSDPNGYAIVCSGYCTTTIPSENNNSVTVVIPAGTVTGRVDIPPGDTFAPEPGYEVKADPNDTMSLGSTTTP